MSETNGEMSAMEIELFRRMDGDHSQDRDAFGILTPDATLMTRMPDGPDDHIARGMHANHVKRVLTELRATKKQRFQGAKGTVDILFTEENEDGEIESFIVPFKIRSIPEHALKKELREYQQIAQAVPQRTNPETGEKEPDYGDPDFLSAAQAFADAQEHLMFSKLLMGLDMAIYDEQDAPVWRPGGHGANDRDEAIRILTEVYEITAAHIREIVDAIEALTAGAVAQADEEFEKN